MENTVNKDFQFDGDIIVTDPCYLFGEYENWGDEKSMAFMRAQSMAIGAQVCLTQTPMKRWVTFARMQARYAFAMQMKKCLMPLRNKILVIGATPLLRISTAKCKSSTRTKSAE